MLFGKLLSEKRLGCACYLFNLEEVKADKPVDESEYCASEYFARENFAKACRKIPKLSFITYGGEMKTFSRTAKFLALGILLASMILAGCKPKEVASTEINVLCTPQEEWCQGMKQEFETKYGITVNYVRMSSGEALARVQAEKDNPQFDIWWGGPVDSFVAAM